MNRIKEIWEYRYMISRLVHKELRGKYKGSVLGVLWTFINPLLQVIVYTIVFSTILRSDLENYYIYLIVGIIPWFFFNNGTIMGLGTIRYQGDIVKKIYFPKEVLPISSVLANFVTLLVSLIVVYIFLFASGVGIELSLQLWMPIILLTELLFTLGIAILLAGLEVYFRDLEYIFGVIMMVWMYMTPVFYSSAILPKWILDITKWNPMYHIIEMYHNVLYYKTAPSIVDLNWSLGFALLFLVLGEFVFSRIENGFAEEL